MVVRSSTWEGDRRATIEKLGGKLDHTVSVLFARALQEQEHTHALS